MSAAYRAGDPPVVPLLHADLHLSETQIGWLSSLPPMLFAIAAVPGSLLIARFGLLRLCWSGCCSLRSAARRAARFRMRRFYLRRPSSWRPASRSCSRSLPPLVRTWFPKAIGFATAVYTTGLLVGEILRCALTIPLVLPLVHDSWRLNFAVWSLAGVADCGRRCRLRATTRWR